MSGHSKGRSRAHEEEEHEEGGERWLVTYADMLTLLMVLFIVLFASSNIDKKKYAGLQKSLSKAFSDGSPATSGGAGVLDGGTTLNNQNGKLAGNPVGPGNTAGQLSPNPDLTSLEKTISKALAAKGLSSSVQQKIDGRGLVITIVTDQVLFKSGSALLLPDGVKILDALAPSLVDTGRAISVGGHTDDVPISSSAYPDNRFLSDARAEVVVHQLLHDGVPDKGLSSAGYGDTEPVASNADAAGRGKNRRVEIIVSPVSANDTTATSTTAGATATSTTATGSQTVTGATSGATTATGAEVGAGAATAGLLPGPAPSITAFPAPADVRSGDGTTPSTNQSATGGSR